MKKKTLIFFGVACIIFQIVFVASQIKTYGPLWTFLGACNAAMLNYTHIENVAPWPQGFSAPSNSRILHVYTVLFLGFFSSRSLICRTQCETSFPHSWINARLSWCNLSCNFSLQHKWRCHEYLVVKNLKIIRKSL